MKSLNYFILLIGMFIYLGCSGGGNGEPNSSCVNKENIGESNSCLAATVLVQGNPFPSPIQSGGTVNLQMKIGAVDSNFTPISASISTKVFSSSTGQLVTQQNAGTVSSSANFQNVPVWTNINVASGTYYLEVTIDVGVCGSKTICLSEKRIIVNG